MTHDIIDNRQERLVEHIRDILASSQAAHLAVGYFFLSGLEALADRLENVAALRLLIGCSSDSATIEQLAEGYRRLEQVQRAAEQARFQSRDESMRAADQTAGCIGQDVALLDQTASSERLVGTLVRLIESGKMQVRVYTRGRLHAKAYIFDYGAVYDAAGRELPREERGIAIIGSSNLTLSGVTTNTELNVLVHGNANHAALTQWFEELWREAEPFEQRLMTALGCSWPLAAITPYELYLKALYELARDDLAEGAEEPFLWPDDITAVLADFQLAAVRQAVRMIARYGGCFVADVVGLGKSYIGAAVLKHLQRHERARPLIICPAGLVGMWEHYNEAYDLGARVLSLGALKEDERWGEEWLSHDERYATRDLVLVDESHAFRNTDSQRYRVLASYLATGRRCVFLTATPRNKSAWDIYHQLKLFHPDDRTEVPVDPPNLREYFQMAERGERSLPALLGHLLIRRTRRDVLRWYGYDAETERRIDPSAFAPYRAGVRRAYVLVGGRKQFFPQRTLTTIEYSIEAAYQGLYERLRQHLGASHQVEGEGGNEGLSYARYGLWNYVKRAKREHSPYQELHRAGANLRGLIRVMLFKRFESSVQAFRETLRRMLAIHRHWLSALDRGIVPAGEEAQALLYEAEEGEEDALLEALRGVSGRYQAADFNLAALRADIAHDAEVLDEMLALVAPITPAQDAKLRVLQEWLKREPLNRGKRLIFTQYADTAQYLYKALNPDGSDPATEVIYSRERNRAEIVGRFAPRANPAQRPPEGTPAIETLIGTDVLSEGLNLQDCDKLVNYDLHWNPVRLIQRFGRIDRIGSEHERIYAYNFLPETELDRTLGLRETLARRIAEIHETIGEDAAILASDEQLNEEALYSIYLGRDAGALEAEEEEEESLGLQEAQEIMRQLRQDQPELYQRISTLCDGVRTARGEADGHGSDRRTFVFCRVGRFRELMLLDAASEVLTRDIGEVLRWLRCTPDTPAAPLPTEHNARVMAALAAFRRDAEARTAEQQHTLALSRAQQYVQRALRALYGPCTDPDQRRQIERLEAVFCRATLRPAVAGALRRLQREGTKDQALLDALAGLHYSHGLEAPSSQVAPVHAENDELPRVVCSEAG